MAEPKTKPTTQKAEEFLSTVEPDEKRRDSFEILEMMQRITGEKPVMWGTSIVGFGLYHFKSERSTQEGDWPLIGFSPRKQNLTLYVLGGFPGQQELIKKIGKCKTSKVCLYVNRLSDIDMDVLALLIKKSFAHSKHKYAGQ